jgi:uncharacterized protein (DUF2147 family)
MTRHDYLMKAAMSATFVLVLTLAAAVPLLSQPSANQPSSISGDWRVADGSAVVRVEPCGDRMCGRIAQLVGDPDALDEANPSPALATRRVCGITILHGLQASAAAKWTGGQLYDPESGKTLNGVSVMQKGDRLQVSIGSGPFAGAETWRRVPAVSRPCAKT